jgi:putative ABC transport system permease protein
MINNVIRDLKHAVRVLGKNPAFALTALAILAIGIGASTAVFSEVDAVLIRPLPVADQSGLVLAWKRDILSNNPVAELSIPEFRDWQAQNRVFSSVAALPTTVYGYGYTVTGTGEPFQIESARVSAGFFSVLGVRPELGRVITDSEDHPGAPRTVVLSHSLWQTRFNSDPDLIGRELTMNGLGFIVVGVMPAHFDFPSGADVWTALSTETRLTENRGAVFLQVIGRLKPGVNMRQAQADLDSVIANIATHHPEARTENERAVIIPLTSYVLGSARPALFLLLGASALLLLIACTNVSGLMLGRAVSRKREFAVRAALGAGRARLISQLFTESLLLATAGGLLGTALATWLVDICKKVAPADVPRIADAHLNPHALGFAVLIALISATLFGLAPALAASKIDLGEALKDASPKTAGGGPRLMRSTLVVAEVAITLVLTVTAVLVALSFRSLQRVDLGFDPSNLLTAEVSIRGSDYAAPAKKREWYRQLLERLESHPEVAAAGMDLVRPLEGRIGWDVPFQAEGQSPQDVPANPVPNFEIITPHYFRAMGIQLIAGREFNEQDTFDGEPVVIVSRATAIRSFGDKDSAVGKRIKLSPLDSDSPWSTIVGVVADARYRALDDPRLNVYVPYTQRNFPGRYVMIRMNRGIGLATAAALLREEVAKLDGSQAISALTTMDEMVGKALARPRFSMILLLSFALIAAFLATIGVYGIVAYNVAERTREIGIRMALGAPSDRVLLMVTMGVLKLAVGGILIGSVIALATTPMLSGLLYDVQPVDPLVFGAVASLLLLAALGAAYLPARRAASVDPVVALRRE